MKLPLAMTSSKSMRGSVGRSMTVRRHDFIEKIVSSRDARSPLPEFSITKYRCSTPFAGEGSDSLEFCVHCALAVEKNSRTKTPALSFRTVFLDQRLESRIFTQRIPNWV